MNALPTLPVSSDLLDAFGRPLAEFTRVGHGPMQSALQILYAGRRLYLASPRNPAEL